MADRFFTRDVLDLGEYCLEGPEAHHLAHVRRFAPGDVVTLFNGTGAEYNAEVISVAKRNAVLNITQVIPVDRELRFPLVVAAALPKGNRADFLIEKLTELGVTRFIPLVTDRSIVQPKESTIDRYERAVIEASKQCGRNTLMAVECAQTWSAFLKREDLPGQRYLLHPNGTTNSLAPVSRGVVISIGPEGGFTEQEIEAARHQEWTILSLGLRILRIETAAIAAVSLFVAS